MHNTTTELLTKENYTEAIPQIATIVYNLNHNKQGVNTLLENTKALLQEQNPSIISQANLLCNALVYMCESDKTQLYNLLRSKNNVIH